MPPECEELEHHAMPEKISCIDGKIKDPLRSVAAATFYGRRAMVNKFRCQEIVRKWFYKKDEPPHPRVFSEPKCQRYAASWFLLYRWLIFTAWATIVICSLFEIGSYEPFIAYDKWPIYLTNWDLLLGLSQALLGGFLASRRWKLQKITDFDPLTLTMGSMERAYWFLCVVTTNIAFAVTINYWCSVYNPAIHHLDPLNIMLHICNSILMIVDFCISSIPFKLRNFWWCVPILLLYVILTLVYYTAGGLDKYGYHYIYKIVDWKKPLKTTLVCTGEVIFVTLLHSMMCFLEKIKNHIYLKVDTKLGKSSSDAQKTVASKQADIV